MCIFTAIYLPVDINSYFLPNAIEWNYVVPQGFKSQNFNLIDAENILTRCSTSEAAIFDNQYDVVTVEITLACFIT